MALFATSKGKIVGVVMLAFFVHFLFTVEAPEKATPTQATVEPAPNVPPVLVAAPQPSPAEVAAAAADQRAAAEERANNERYGVYCLSLWDGSHDRFVDAVKDAINDPDSFEHDTTTTWPVNAEGRNTIIMNFRARNALGGMVRVKAAGSFDNESCSDIRIDLIE
jgi:hypothetical protein